MRMTWVAVGDSNTCGDCIDRHGTTHTEEDWQRVHGEPRSVLADTACGRRCRCVLFPRLKRRGPIEARRAGARWYRLWHFHV